MSAKTDFLQNSRLKRQKAPLERRKTRHIFRLNFRKRKRVDFKPKFFSFFPIYLVWPVNVNVNGFEPENGSPLCLSHDPASCAGNIAQG